MKPGVIIDIHCHILPGLDDGSPDIESSLEMARIASADGVRKIIATPHVDENGPGTTIIKESVEELNYELQQRDIDLVVLPGAELAINMVDKVSGDYCLAGSNFVLLEFPHAYVPVNGIGLVLGLNEMGFKPIIAHPERNFEVSRGPQKLAEFIAAGAFIQITADSITGQFGPDQKLCSEYLLKQDMVHFIASDSHSPTFRRPVLSKAFKRAAKLIGREKASMLVTGNPLSIVQGCS